MRMCINEIHCTKLVLFIYFYGVQSPLKILIVRFSSIGDIVLTTPVLRNLYKQTNCEIHYLTKDVYRSILKNNPYVKKIFGIKSSTYEVVNQLREEKYDYIIDLHNNIRSNIITTKLNVVTKRYLKGNINKLMYIYIGVNFLDNRHVVDRYMHTIKFLGVINDNKGLDYFVEKKDIVDFNTDQKYISWCIGATYQNKKLPIDKIISVSEKMSAPIVLLGGSEEVSRAEKIINESQNKNIYNFCGVTTINQSAYLIKKSRLVLTNDTGMMHIGAAFKKPIISFWGCTKPALGFSPYQNNNKSIFIVGKNSQRACSKHGKECRNRKGSCIENLSVEEIINAYNIIAKEIKL